MTSWSRLEPGGPRHASDRGADHGREEGLGDPGALAQFEVGRNRSGCVLRECEQRLALTRIGAALGGHGIGRDGCRERNDRAEIARRAAQRRGLDTGIANRAVGGELDDAGGPGLERATSSRRLGASRAGDEPRPNAREHQPERMGGARGASERARHGTGSAKIARVEPGATRRAAIAVASAGVGARSSVAAGSRRRR